MNIFFDAHQDLAYNILSFDRDYSQSVQKTRANEKGKEIPGLDYQTLLGQPEYNRGRVALVFGTLFAAPARRDSYPHPKAQIYYTPQEANQVYWNQLKLYHQLAEEKPGTYRLITTRSLLQEHLAEWESLPEDPQPDDYLPLGIIPSMEGAEGLTDLAELPEWWQAGLRAIGLAWAGNQFCGGTREPGPLTKLGKALINEMAEVGFILDISHMDEAAAFECLDFYQGKIIASHANAASLVKGYNSNRLLSDELIIELAKRDGVIGVVPWNNFLNAEWVRDGGRSTISLSMVAEQIDHICQLTGSANHVGIGTDFDGGFGLASVPPEIDSIADLQKINPLLAGLGYEPGQIKLIDAGNFLRVLEYTLPE